MGREERDRQRQSAVVDTRTASLVDLDEVDGVVEEIKGFLLEDLQSNPVNFLGDLSPGMGADQILAEAMPLLDDQFFFVCRDLFTAIINEMRELKYGETRMVKNACILMVYEMFRTYYLHRKEIRKVSRKPVFYAHMFKTAYRSVKINGSCGLTSILGMIKHDDFEDYPELINGQNLIRPELYVNRFDADEKDNLRKLKGRLWRSVSGMTKVTALANSVLQDVDGVMGAIVYDGLSFASSEEATVYAMIKAARDEIRVIPAKACDRGCNMWESSVPPTENQKAKARQTLQVVTPLVRKLYLSGSVDDHVNAGVHMLNPVFEAEFRNLSDERVRRFEKNKDAIIAKIKNVVDEPEEIVDEPEEIADGPKEFVDEPEEVIDEPEEIVDEPEEIVDIRFVPFSLAHYLRKLPDLSVLEHMNVSDLKIPPIDPMCEVVVVTRDRESIPDVQRKLATGLYFGSSRIVDLDARDQHSGSFWTDTAGHEVGADSGRVARKKSQEGVSDYLHRGVLIKGSSAELGTQMIIRINDDLSERRLNKGLLSTHKKGQDSVAPSFVRRELDGLLKGRRSGEISNLMIEGRETAFRPETRFYTPGFEVRRLPAGATYLDAACSVDPSFLIGLKKSVDRNGRVMYGIGFMEDRLSSEQDLYRCFVDEIPVVDDYDEKIPVITLDSVLSGKDPSTFGWQHLDQIHVSPAWIHFCKTRYAQSRIRAFLTAPAQYLGLPSEMDEVRAINIGRKYFEQLCGMFGDEFRRLFKHVDEAFYHEVGCCKIDPFKEYIAKADARREWTLEIDIPKQSGEYGDNISPYFKAAKLSIDPEKKYEDIEDLRRWTIVVTQPENKSGFVDSKALMHTLLKIGIGRGYKIRIVS